jgi:phosphoribosylformylglycinamidine synthase
VIELEAAHRVDRELLPEVVLCAETQERYCWVVPEDFAGELCALYERAFALGDVHPGAGARVIGRAVPEPRYTVTWHGETLGRLRRERHHRGPARGAREPAAPAPAVRRAAGGARPTRGGRC